jgi:hypothetical protein
MGEGPHVKKINAFILVIFEEAGREEDDERF